MAASHRIEYRLRDVYAFAEFIPVYDQSIDRTFGWLGRYRRLSRDFEHTVSSSESVVYIASIRRMLKLATN
jgi:hypothetical protein